MTSRSKDKGSGKGKGSALMAQMGLFGDMAAMEADIYGDLENDDELEAELRALQEEDAPTKSTPKGGLAAPQSGMKKIPSGLLQLDRMVAESMKDIENEEVSDTEDPDLEAELLELAGTEDDTSYEPPSKTTPSPPKPSPSPPKSASSGTSSGGSSLVTTIQDRLDMYEKAHSNAVSAGDSSKARRLDRGVKTLKDQLKKAKAGKAVAEDDIPPPVAVGANKSGPTSQSSTPTQPPQQQQIPTYEPTVTPSSNKPSSPPVTVGKQSPHAPEVYQPPSNLSPTDQQMHKMLHLRQEQFKSAALEAKSRGDKTNAQRYFRTFKQFDTVIKALESGNPVDLSQMPPPPPGYKAPQIKIERESTQGSANMGAAEDDSSEPIPQTSAEEKQKIYQAPQAAGSVLEALQQRLEKYKEGETKAKEENNGSKARRMGRIVKQYEDAIKMNKAGKPYAYEDLPTPPGFPALPVAASQPAAAAKPAPATQPAPKPAVPSTSTSNQVVNQQPSVKSPQQKPKPVQRQMSALSRAEQQALFLQERQLEFKKAALKAKQNGDMELAKKYMKQAKGFDQMIEALHQGLPVNMEQIPKLPGAQTGNLEFVPEGQDGQEMGDRDEMYKKLEQELIQQIRTATTNAEHFTKLGDVSSATKFDKMCLSARKDLDALKNAYKHGDPVPRFHYENRSFSMVKSCTDLGDNDLDLHVVRGINYNLPSDYKPTDLDTYVKYEFPFPKDEPQKGDSNTCKHTNSPEYDQSFKINVERKSRVFMRILNSKSIKIDIFYRRGFFKGDKLLGTANIKLQPLENVCELHESYDLMDGRKAVGGKLEVKLRVRNPFINKQVEQVQEKWLVIDKFERSLQPSMAATKNMGGQHGQQRLNEQPAKANMTDYTSMEVLKYEKQLLEQQIRRYQGKLNTSELDSLQHKCGLLDKRVEQIREQLRKTGISGLRNYADTIEKSQNQYVLEAKALVQQGNREKAQVMMTKKKLVEKEVEGIRSKIPK